VKHSTIPIKLKKAFCDAFIEKVYVFDDDDGNGKSKKTRGKIIFDAFESEGLLGFDEAEIEISSKMETLVFIPDEKRGGHYAPPFAIIHSTSQIGTQKAPPPGNQQLPVRFSNW
jgi:hypothetical protein